MYEYKGYNPKNSKHVQKYNKDHYKIVGVPFDREYYNDTLKPLCDSLGISVSSFVRDAVKEKVDTILKDGSK